MILMAAWLCTLAAIAERLVVVDFTDGESVPSAAVFDASGHILGLTDTDGALDIPDGAAMPLTVRCTGYAEGFAESHGTLFLTPDVRELPEVKVLPGDRPVLHALCYMRIFTETCTGSDTTQSVGEYMADFLLPLQKAKGAKTRTEPRVLSGSTVTRVHTDGKPDSIYRTTLKDEWLPLHLLTSYPSGRSDSPLGQGSTVLVQGKHGPILTATVRPDRVTLFGDILADHKGHVWTPPAFKLLGMTLDITRMDRTGVYADDSGQWSPLNLSSLTHGMEMTCRGKMFKKAFHTDGPVYLRVIIEYYPVELTPLTAAESAKVAKTAPDTQLCRPNGIAAAPLSLPIEL